MRTGISMMTLAVSDQLALGESRKGLPEDSALLGP